MKNKPTKITITLVLTVLLSAYGFLGDTASIAGFSSSDEPIVVKNTHITQQQLPDVELRSTSFHSTTMEVRKLVIFDTMAAHSEFKAVISNNSNIELTNCALNYEYTLEGAPEGQFFYATKAILSSAYYKLSDDDRYNFKIGHVRPLSLPVEAHRFSLESNTDKEMSFTTEPFMSLPEAIRFYVSCDQKISENVVINKKNMIYRQG
ncbi:hypothetical protein [Vibrio hepatarius]|uniref:Uncharacterized protein n=1 Tax=Vibrio hepatarius TaxID=171383 RepID=A0A0M0HY46_9VIBR|nr:hypothetical protein [Vibrio hepatarius]KOO06994.1 hypothetical protein AKJ31_14985 [Vibrio hepatarius]